MHAGHTSICSKLATARFDTVRLRPVPPQYRVSVVSVSFRISASRASLNDEGA